MEFLNRMGVEPVLKIRVENRIAHETFTLVAQGLPGLRLTLTLQGSGAMDGSGCGHSGLYNDDIRELAPGLSKTVACPKCPHGCSETAP